MKLKTFALLKMNPSTIKRREWGWSRWRLVLLIFAISVGSYALGYKKKWWHHMIDDKIYEDKLGDLSYNTRDYSFRTWNINKENSVLDDREYGSRNSVWRMHLPWSKSIVAIKRRKKVMRNLGLTAPRIFSIRIVMSPRKCFISQKKKKWKSIRGYMSVEVWNFFMNLI